MKTSEDTVKLKSWFRYPYTCYKYEGKNRGLVIFEDILFSISKESFRQQLLLDIDLTIDRVMFQNNHITLLPVLLSYPKQK